MALIRLYDRPHAFRLGTELERMQREMNRLFGDLMGGGAAPLRTGGVFPPVNVSEDADNLYVNAELPGVSPDQIEISVEGDTLTLRGERRLAEAGEHVNYHRREREAGRFRRILTLPVKIDPDKVSAGFKYGVLQVTLPKAAEIKPKQIKVKTD